MTNVEAIRNPQQATALYRLNAVLSVLVHHHVLVLSYLLFVLDSYIINS